MLPSTKLTLWVFVLPISVLILSDLATFLYYKTIDVPASISAIVVLLLVWERLRDSLSKKLEYLHKNYLFRLYQAFQSDVIYFSQDLVKRVRADLEKYGKIMGISLYPKNLLNHIDEFLTSQTEFDSSLQKLNELVEQYGLSPRKSPSDRQVFYHFIGINPLQSLSSYSAKFVDAYRKRVPLVLKEQSQPIEKIKGLMKKTEKMRKQIFEKLEDFFKSNNLRLEPEPVHYLRP